jgi:hypothetical protein
VPDALGKALKTLGKHSLPSVALCKEGLAYSASAKPSLRVLFLGHSTKRFAECQRALGKEKQPLRRRVAETESLPSVCQTTLGKESIFAECHLGHSAKNPPERVPMLGSLPSARYGTRQRMILCRVLETLHSAKNLYRCPGLGSLPSAVLDTPQSTSLLSVTLVKVTSRNLFYLFFIFHPNKQKISHIHHIYHIYTSQISSQTYIANANINIHHKLKCSTRVSNTNISLIRLKL